jgi:V/A-type H+-transporting ATPase subunit I
VILAMAKLRILGPRERLVEVLESLQDLNLLHLAPPGEVSALVRVQLSPREERERRQLRRALTDVETVLEELRPAPAPARGEHRATPAELARWARLAGQARREVDRLSARGIALAEERALILKYQQFFSAFRTLLEAEARWPNASTYHVLLKSGDLVPRLRASLTAVIGKEFELYAQPLASGETAVMVVVSAQVAGRVERLLAEAQVQEVPVPAAYGGKSLAEAIPRMVARLGDLPREEADVKQRRAQVAAARGPELRRARAAIHDRLDELEALPLLGVTPRAFVLEGWTPVPARRALDARLHERFGDTVVVAEVAREEWRSEEAPVVLQNPRLFRPFETVIRLLPLPRYGTIDPTPFVAVFFPVFFGIMLGDVGYGLVLAALGLILHRRSAPGSVLRSVSEMIGPCALFTILAGFLFGEFFGDLGHRWFGLAPIAFRREDALLPFLLLAVSLGAVHILLGLGLGVLASVRGRHPREAFGRGVGLLMVLLVILALLAALRVLPQAFFTPAVIGLLVAFPALIALEGLVAPIELLTTLGNILSYARIMALGVASVMLAIVANKMAGAIGSVAVGVTFALLFHLVNFAIGVFSPTIHALRLHYVEFFGKFYSPGGVRYQPFGHWTPARVRP